MERIVTETFETLLCVNGSRHFRVRISEKLTTVVQTDTVNFVHRIFRQCPCKRSFFSLLPFRSTRTIDMSNDFQTLYKPTACGYRWRLVVFKVGDVQFSKKLI